MTDEEAKLGPLFDREPLLVGLGDYLGGDMSVFKIRGFNREERCHC